MTVHLKTRQDTCGAHLQAVWRALSQYGATALEADKLQLCNLPPEREVLDSLVRTILSQVRDRSGKVGNERCC